MQRNRSVQFGTHKLLSNDWKWEKHQLHPQRKIGCHLQSQGWIQARESWDVKIEPELNHDLFSFTKAMKDGWQMNGRWKEGGLMIELFKTTRASMKFDRMIPS